MRGVKNRDAHVVIVAVPREDERGVGIVELARDGEHLGVGEAIRIEHHARGIAGERCAGEGIDLVNLDFSRHRSELCGSRGRILVASCICGVAA